MSDEKCVGSITPDTNLADLFREYPDLEAVVADLSPSFGALESPALRQAVARSTTVAGLVRADGLSIGEVIARLREEAGQGALADDGSSAGAPPWANPDSAARSLDARQIIESGGHPLERVMQGVGELGSGEVYELITPFTPTPLIELVRARGLESHCMAVAPNEFRTYFRRP